MPELDPDEQNRQYKTIAKAIDFIRDHAKSQPTLEQIAHAVNMSEYHLQKTFSSWAGITPKRFLQFLNKESAIQALKENQTIIDAVHQTGLSSGGRLYDLTVTCEALTPGEIKSAGRGVTMEFGEGLTPFGEALIGWTKRGICHLVFLNNKDLDQQLFRSLWPEAEFQRDTTGAQNLLDQIFKQGLKPGKVHLLLKGTNFQIKVWQALLKVGHGQLVSYQQLAQRAGCSKAARAIGGAMSANSIAYLIPCHRVIRQSGELSHYQWGPERKAAIQIWERQRIQG